MSKTDAIANLLTNFEWLQILHDTGMLYFACPLDLNTIPPGISSESWKELQKDLLETSYFAQEDSYLYSTPEGKKFLHGIAEIHRGLTFSRYSRLLDCVRKLPRGPALDLGCGTGYMLKKMAELGYSPLYGYDFSTISLEIAEIYLNDFKGKVILYGKDGTLMNEINDETLALIFSRVSLHYFDQKKVAATLKRVLLPGGYFVAELVGIRYYLQKKHFRKLYPRYWRKMLSTLAVLIRTSCFEVLGQQWKLMARTPEIGYSLHAISKLAALAELDIIEITSAPTSFGSYLVIMKKEAENGA